MKQFLLILTLLVTVTGQVIHAQTKSEVLTNAAIINLVKVGLEDDLIISKIETTPAKFDVSTNALVALKTQKVSSNVIKAMIGKTNGAPVTVTKKPQAGSIPSLDLVNQVYRYQKSSNTVTPLEKASAIIKSKLIGLGYGGAKLICTVEGDKSPIRITDSTMVFVIHPSGMSPSEFALYKLESKKGKRQATLQKVNSGFKFGSTATEAGASIPFDVKQLQENAFQLKPLQVLSAGEYIFATKSPASGGTVDVYAFGIDQ